MKFIDSNVLIYVTDDTDARKQRVARSIVCDAISSNGFMESAQAINEFCAVSFRKLRKPNEMLIAFWRNDMVEYCHK